MHGAQKESQEFEFQDLRFPENSEPQPGIPEPSGEGKKSDNADADIKTTWLSLFAFTTTSHIPTLIPAIILTTLAGGLKPTISIFLGHILDDLASYVSGTITQAELLQDVSKWCIILVGLGVGAWLTNGGFFALWLAFGEAQAKSARVKIFKGMLEKEMSWFDLQRDGTGSLLVRIQT
jgi:ATP-binding cassette subfamily B (MDR/TAP) protein 1